MNVHEIITSRILSEIDKGTIPWHKPWKGANGEEPANLITRRPYSGINRFLCSLARYERPYFLTYNQASMHKGQVRRGEKAIPVIYWQKTVKKQEDGSEKLSFFLRYYNVFNIQQCDGLSHLLPHAPSQEPSSLTPDAKAEAIVMGYTNGPKIRRMESNQAYYQPATDSVTMPQLSQFSSTAEFYSTLYHELTHSTGHASRLNRPTLTGSHFFGDHLYSKEELIAEFGAAFLCGEAGITNEAALRNSASYIDGWAKKLRQDSTLLVTAAAQAQKAANHILGRQKED